MEQLKCKANMDCYLCKSAMVPFLTKNGFEIWRCPACGLGQTDFGGDYESFVERYYAKGYFTGNPKYGAYANYWEDRGYIVQNMKKFLAKVREHKRVGKLLDAGCAMGFFVELALEAGFDAYGFDASTYAVKQGKQRLNGRLTAGTIHSVGYSPKSFDVITMCDIIEHLDDPVRDLQKMATLLKDDGILLVATGDTGSLAAKLLKRRWTFYIPPQHLYFWHRKNLETLLVRSGFEPVDWSRIGKWLSLRYVLHLARSAAESQLGQHLFTLVQRLKLGGIPLYLPMGDNMIVLARKARTSKPTKDSLKTEDGYF